jgi:uncharacterized cupredoxin-like copper-binding protein
VTRLARMLSLVAVAAIVGACGANAPAGSPTPVPSGTVAVSASEFKFDPSALSVPAGSVTFGVHNKGNIEHEFEIFKGDAVVDEIEGILPGQTKDLTVTLEAGDYTFLCKLSGHAEAGMKGTITVAGS